MTSGILSTSYAPLLCIDQSQLEILYQDLLKQDRATSYLPTYPTLSVKLDGVRHDAHATFIASTKHYKDIIELSICTDAVRPHYRAFAVVRKTGSAQWEIGPKNVSFTDHDEWVELDDAARRKELALS